MTPGQASFVVKATRLCNLRCTYCHDWRDGPGQTMPFQVLARLTATALAEPEHRRVEFIWHGGEPTVLPMSFYRKALFLQEQFRRPGQDIRNTVQTNGTRITDEWAAFLRDYQFRVGVSLDGPPEVHDRERRYVSGRPSWDDVAQGMARLRAHGVAFQVLMVVDERVLQLGADGVFDFLVANGITHCGFNAATPTNQPSAGPHTPTDHYVTPARMNAFLAGLYDRWEEHGDPGLHVREFDGLRRRLAGQAPGYCKLAGACLGRYYIVEPDGAIAHCDLFLGDPAYHLGNVMTESWAELRAGIPMACLTGQREAELDAMRACPEFALCQGWCPHEQYLARRHDPAYRDTCCGLRGLIDHVRNRLDLPTLVSR
ncbi:MAG: radical SAM protein [Acidimicrobiales bacterium]